jgi:histidinol phosphatase-like PHP family hydrolase
MFLKLSNVKEGRASSGERKEIRARIAEFLHSPAKALVVFTSKISKENLEVINGARKNSDVLVFKSDAVRLRKYEYQQELKEQKAEIQSIIAFDALDKTYFAGLEIVKA